MRLVCCNFSPGCTFIEVNQHFLPDRLSVSTFVLELGELERERLMEMDYFYKVKIYSTTSCFVPCIVTLVPKGIKSLIQIELLELGLSP